MEKRMIKKIKKKDPAGLDYIINVYSKKVYILVNKIIGNFGKEDVEECVSDVFYKVWENIDEYDDKKGSFSTFIFIKSKYLALDYKRKLEKKEISKIELEDNITTKENTEHLILDKENRKEIINLIKGFKEPDKTYFFHRYFMYHKIEDVAEKFKVSRSSVENRLYRCRLAIKEFIEGRNKYEG